jgi:type II secretory pathway pseudopilin PulG
MNTIIAIVVAISATASAFLWAVFAGAKRGRKEERFNQQMKDLENAQDIRRRADDADKRMRDHDDAGFRD